MKQQFQVGDVVRTDDDYIRGECSAAGGDPDQMVVRSIDACGDPVFTWESEGDTVGYHSNRHQLVCRISAGNPLSLLDLLLGKSLKFRSGCPVKFIAYVADAKPHCQLVLLNPATGNVVTRYVTGKASDEPHDEPGDILLAEERT